VRVKVQVGKRMKNDKLPLDGVVDFVAGKKIFAKTWRKIDGQKKDAGKKSARVFFCVF
jgi:hypothetical protein